MVNRLIGSLIGHLLILLLVSFSLLLKMTEILLVVLVVFVIFPIAIWNLLKLITYKVEILWDQLVSKVKDKYATINMKLWLYFMMKKVVLEEKNKLIKDPKIYVLVKLLSLGDDYFYYLITKKSSRNDVVLTPEETNELYKNKRNELDLLEKKLTKQYQDKIGGRLYSKYESLSITEKYNEDLKRVQANIKYYSDEINKPEKEGQESSTNLN